MSSGSRKIPPSLSPFDTISTTVALNADLKIALHGPKKVTKGDSAKFKFRTVNDGPDTAQLVVVADLVAAIDLGTNTIRLLVARRLEGSDELHDGGSVGLERAPVGPLGTPIAVWGGRSRVGERRVTGLTVPLSPPRTTGRPAGLTSPNSTSAKACPNS